jgi:thioredoxin 1
MVPIVNRVAADFEGRALVGAVDTRAQGALASAYSISLVPTFVFFEGGRETSRVVGTMTYDELAARLQALLASP